MNAQLWLTAREQRRAMLHKSSLSSQHNQCGGHQGQQQGQIELACPGSCGCSVQTGEYACTGDLSLSELKRVASLLVELLSPVLVSIG